MEAKAGCAWCCRRTRWVLVAVWALLAVSTWGQEPKEKDDPGARQRYLEEVRGVGTSPIPPGARRRALEEVDEMVREEGERYWKKRTQAATSDTTGAASEGGIAGGSPGTSQWLFIGPQPTRNNPFGGPPHSGRSTAIVVDPTDPTGNTVYIGAAQGGVWKTTDGGASWTPLTDSQPSLATGSMAIDGGTTPATVYVGTGEQGFAFDSYYGAGILKSSDSGTTWETLGTSVFGGAFSGCNSEGTTCGGAFIGGLAVRRIDGVPVLLAAVTKPGASGIYRSADGGTNWTLVKSVDTGTSRLGASAVEFATDTVAYAGIDGTTERGIYKSIDGGVTWNPSNGSGGTSIDTASSNRIELAVAKSQPNTIYASVASGGSLVGLYRSVDGGASWLPTNIGDYCTPQCWYDNIVAVSPVDPNVVFVGGAANAIAVSRTTNGGVSWITATDGIHVDHHAGAFTPDGTKLYWGTDGGVYSTTNTTSASSSVVWTNLNSTLGITQFYGRFALHRGDVNIAYGGTQDNGTQRYNGYADLSNAWDWVTCGDGASAVIDAFDPSYIYANCQNVDVRRSASGGEGGFGLANNAGSGIATNEPVTFIPPMVGDDYRDALNHIYFGTNRVYQSKNQAVSWTAISPTLTSGCGGGFSAITNMAVAPSDRNIMYAGTCDGRLWKGTNLGTTPTFEELGNTGMVVGRRINAIAVSPANPNVVYVGISGFSSLNTQHIYKRDIPATLTWTDISTGLPNSPVNDIVLDPDSPGTIHLANDVGVFKSTDDGANWVTAVNNLPRVAVYGLKLHRASRTLRAATHGRGFWDLSVPITGPGGVFVPGSLNFGSLTPGTTSSAQTLAFENNGTAATVISSVTRTGDYAITADSCAGATVNPGASCQISVTFTPTAFGHRGGTLSVASNVASSPTVASLSGNGGPDNDNFANAMPVNSDLFTHSVSTLGASVESGDPPSIPCATGSAVSKTVWYSYTAPFTGQVNVNTQGSNYDTILSVWTGNHGSLTSVACDDDGVAAGGASRVGLNVTSGTTYRIMVSGFVPSDGGNLTFNLRAPRVTPSGLTFQPAVVGRRAPSLSVTFVNEALVTATFSSITATGDYSQTNNCVSVASGGSCVVTVSFQPTASGARNGTLTVNSSVGSLSAALSGTGVNFTLSLSRPQRPGRTGTGASVVIQPGGSATVELEVASSVALDEPAVLDCEAPAGITCRVTPSRLRLDGSQQRLAVRLTGRPSGGAQRLNGALSPAGSYEVKVRVAVAEVEQVISIPVEVSRRRPSPRLSSSPVRNPQPW